MVHLVGQCVLPVVGTCDPSVLGRSGEKPNHLFVSLAQKLGGACACLGVAHSAPWTARGGLTEPDAEYGRKQPPGRRMLLREPRC